MAPKCQNIANLDILIEELPDHSKEIFNRIFSLSTTRGSLKPPQSMLPWIKQQFGSVEAVTQQKIIRVTNLITYEGTVFNSLRSARPRQFEDRLKVESKILDKAIVDPLAEPLEFTPEDPFGRIYGKYCVTASNIAKYEGLHGIVIFNDFNPLQFSREKVIDYLNTGWEWAQTAHKLDPSAEYFFFLWNSLKKAGASVAHGHAQVVLARDSHYSKIEFLCHAVHGYKETFGTDYFEDLYQIHYELGLAVEFKGVRILSCLTPIKEKEVMLLSSALDNDFKECIYHVLACFRDNLFVTAFNLGIATPPLTSVSDCWTDFPVIARIVDRGYPWDGSSDFGTMELYATSIVASDPFRVIEALKAQLRSEIGS